MTSVKPPSKAVAPLINAFMQRKPLRTGSLIVSIFGDSIAPHGGVVWLGSLIQSLTPLGISQRLVRTAVFRLVKDGILHNSQFGRRSYYALTADGRREFEQATARIYQPPRQDWNGQWNLVLISALATRQRNHLRRQLQWLGYGAISSELLVHPGVDEEALSRCLHAGDPQQQAVVFSARPSSLNQTSSLPQLVARTWDLDKLGNAYGDYLSSFAPILADLQAGGEVSATDAFYIRTFAIHEYRKILLRDPGLPWELLPANWSGAAAYKLTRSLYQLTWQAAETYIRASMQDQQGLLPPADAAFRARFGGLD